MNHVNRLWIAIGAILLLTSCASPPAQRAWTAYPATILAIFAHPDDEASVAPVLAKYAASGVRVYLAVATDGRLGVAPHAGYSAGDELAAARADEMRCAAEKLGLQPPILIGLHDQLKMGEGLPAHGEQLRTLRERVNQLMDQLQPDAVITWPPSGWTGHPDHRLVSSIVTEVFLGKEGPRPARLFYPGVSSGRLPKEHPTAAAAMSAEFLNVAIPIEREYYEKAKAAWLCHASQYTPDQIEQLYQSLVAAQQGVAQFQSLPAPARKLTTLLAR